MAPKSAVPGRTAPNRAGPAPAALKHTYTRVDAARSVAEIQRTLARHGARHVTVAFDGDGEPEAVRFTLQAPTGSVEYALPARVEKVARKLQAQAARGVVGRATDRPRDVARRNVLSWIEAQIALVETEQAALDEVFLPYELPHGEGGRTLYELYAARRLALPSPTGA